MVANMFWWLLCLYLTGVGSQGPPPPAAGPEQVVYALKFNSNPSSCDGSSDWMDPSTLETVWFNETTVMLTGMCTLKQGLEPCTMLEIKVLKLANGKEECVMTHEVCDVCNEIGNPESNYYKYLQYLGFPDQCPCDAGIYPVHDLVVDSDELPIESANAGDYLIFMYFYKLDAECNCKGDKQYLACIKLDCTIEPA